MDDLLECFPVEHRSGKVLILINMLRSFGMIQKFARAKFLAEAEVDQLRAEIENCEQFYFKLDRPKITPKAQWLLRHVIPFAEQHGFWGLASEQPIEALHAVVNHDLRRFCGKRSFVELFLLVIEAQIYRNFVFDCM